MKRFILPLLILGPVILLAQEQPTPDDFITRAGYTWDIPESYWDSTTLYTTEYLNGVRTKETKYARENDEWVGESVTYRFEGAGGRLDSTIVYELDQNEVETPKSKTITLYSGDAVVESAQLTWEAANEQWRPLYKLTWQVDAQDQVQTHLHFLWSAPQQMLLAYDSGSYHYNAIGQLDSAFMYEQINGSWEHSDLELYVYDQNGLNTSFLELAYNSGNQSYDSTQRILYHHTSGWIDSVYYQQYSSGWETTTLQVNEYHNSGELSKLAYAIWINDGWQMTSYYMFEFDSTDRLLSSGYYESESVGVFQNTYKYAEEEPSGIAATKHDLNMMVYPNPASDFVKFESARGRLINSIVIYDAKGQRCLVSSPNAVSTSVDVSELESGHYLYRVNAGGKMASGVLIR